MPTDQDAPLELVPPTIVGSWSLAAVEGRRADRSTFEPFGPEVAGSLIYTASRLVSLHIHRTGAPETSATDPAEVSDAEGASGARGYIAYHGSYTWYPDDGLVVHHVEGALFAGWVGSDLKRFAELDGDELTLTAPLGTWAGEPAILVSRWRRAIGGASR